MISENSSNINPEIARLMELLPNAAIAKPSLSYDVFVYDREGSLIETHNDVSPQMAGRIRNDSHRLGYRVNRIQNSNLTGEVNPVEFVPPEQHHSQIIDKPAVFESKYNARTAKNNAKYQQEFFSKANKQLKRVADKSINILVYEKITNKLCFSGTLEDAFNFIMWKISRDNWNMTSFVIYLPSKLFKEMR